jgi:hypothetical protein
MNIAAPRLPHFSCDSRFLKRVVALAHVTASFVVAPFIARAPWIGLKVREYRCRSRLSAEIANSAELHGIRVAETTPSTCSFERKYLCFA